CIVEGNLADHRVRGRNLVGRASFRFPRFPRHDPVRGACRRMAALLRERWKKPMCGELEEEEVHLEEFYNRFADHARPLLAAAKGPAGAQAADALNSYLDEMFRQLLFAASDPDGVPDGVNGYQRRAMEPLVLARIAGFMAAHLPLYE